jgi:hypothetical protein
MIVIAGQSYGWTDPEVWAAGVAFVVLVLLVVTLRRAGRSAAVSEAMAHQIAQAMGQMANRVQSLSDGQQQLAGGLTHVSEAQAVSQAQMLRLMEERLAKVSENGDAEPELVRPQHRAILGRIAAAPEGDRQGAGQYHQAVGRCAVLAGYPVEQADARSVRRDPVA